MKQKKLMEVVEDVAVRFEAAGLFYGHGTDNAFDEAVVLVYYTLALPFEDYFERLITDEEFQAIDRLATERIQTRKPLSYLTHVAYFAGLPFYVDERVIVPRSPIAELIENEFSPWIRPDEIHSVLDLCTGTGCIAIACAKYFPKAQVHAIELSDDALAVAAKNIEEHELQEQVRLIKSDLFEGIEEEKRYDVIVSNPPYVSADEMSELPDEFKHEPEMSLLAEKNGMDLAVKILQQASAYLSERGILVVEVGGGQEVLEALFPEVPFTWLEFERGGDGVFLLTAEQVRHYFG
ncbi:MAG: 50S ribosomal protein L3 N(5)-glutamine methyltransferase [Pseudomonadota bacterium]